MAGMLCWTARRSILRAADSPVTGGTLERLEVLDVQEQKGCILHRLEQPLLPGTEVRGQVDLARRFDYAQQHTADHILTGVIHRRYGLDNVVSTWEKRARLLT